MQPSEDARGDPVPAIAFVAPRIPAAKGRGSNGSLQGTGWLGHARLAAAGTAAYTLRKQPFARTPKMGVLADGIGLFDSAKAGLPRKC